MIDKTILGGLKRVDVSKDKEKTKERVESIWKSAEKSKKHRVLEVSGVKAATVYRIFKEGAITPKVALSIAFALDVNPFYLTGEADEKGAWSKQLFEDFLSAKGYGKQPDESSAERPKKKYQRRAPALVPKAQKDTKAEKVLQTPEIPQAPVQEFTQDELILLLHALTLKARGSASAKQRLDDVVALLAKD